MHILHCKYLLVLFMNILLEFFSMINKTINSPPFSYFLNKEQKKKKTRYKKREKNIKKTFAT